MDIEEGSPATPRPPPEVHVFTAENREAFPVDSSRLDPHSVELFDNEQRNLQSIQHRERLTALDNGSLPSLHANESATSNESDNEDVFSRSHLVLPQRHISDFKMFIRSTRNLEEQLEEFTHAVQKLGSALGLSRASRELHICLKKARNYFERNSEEFLGILIEDIETKKVNKMSRRKRSKKGSYVQSMYGGSLADTYQNEISRTLDDLFDSLVKFEMAVQDFEEYQDVEGDNALQSFLTDIRVLSVSLAYFGIDGDSQELRRYIIARTADMRHQVDELVEAVKRFLKIGVPCISYAQERSTSMLLNAATVSTFFAGVAATTLQYSVGIGSKPILVAVNTLWFSSLVLSIGSAITGLLALTWRQAVFSSPKGKLPWHIRFWIRQGYLVLLVTSVIAFLAGLVLYVLDSEPRVALWIVVGFTAFCAIGLTNVTVWFGRERWNFSKFQPKRRAFMYLEVPSNWWSWAWNQLNTRVLGRRRRGLTLEESSVLRGVTSRRQSSPDRSPIDDKASIIGKFFPYLSRTTSQQQSQTSTDSFSRKTNIRPSPLVVQQISTQSNTASSGGGQGKQHRSERANSGGTGTGAGGGGRHSNRNTLENQDVIQEYLSALKVMIRSSSGAKNDRVVDMQFSPSGRWLVACYKSVCSAYDNTTNFTTYQVLKNHRSTKQVEWAPHKEELLTRSRTSVKLWTVDENDEFVCNRTYELRMKLDDIQWLNDGEFLALAKDACVLFRVDLATGSRVCTNLPNDLTIHEMYNVSDPGRVLLVASRDIPGLAEEYSIDCIIVFRIEDGVFDEEENNNISTFMPTGIFSEPTIWREGTIERKIPLIKNVRTITVCPDFQHFLVSYEDKNPEIWTMKGDGTGITFSHELSLPKELVADDLTWGSAFFLGPEQSIVACSANGTVHFWHRDSHKHLHKMAMVEIDDDSDEPPIFSWVLNLKIPTAACATDEGPLEIWTPSGPPKTGERKAGDKIAAVVGKILEVTHEEHTERSITI